MKKIITLALVLTTIATTAFSTEPTPHIVNANVTNSFNNTYYGAKDVQWETVAGYMKAAFEIDGKKMYAYYRRDGEQIAVTRNMLSTELPARLASDLKEKYKSQWLTELFELSAGGETTYFATLYSADQITVLKADASGSWATFKKTSRSAE